MAEKKDVDISYVNFLREASRHACPFCRDLLPDVDDKIRTHLLKRHADILEGKDLDIADVIQDIKRKANGRSKGWVVPFYIPPMFLAC